MCLVILENEEFKTLLIIEVNRKYTLMVQDMFKILQKIIPYWELLKHLSSIAFKW